MLINLRNPLVLLELTVLVAVVRWLRRFTAAARRSKTQLEAPADARYGVNDMTLLRRSKIATAKVCDYAGEASLVRMPGLDLDKTIFKGVSSKLTRYILQDRLSVEPYWSDRAVSRINAACAKVPRAPVPDQPILDFMRDQCDFAMEHADGSFMDHLQFCFEYGSVHMPKHSAVPLFLHSIMGVGTNLFPMKLEQRPLLAELVSDNDLAHLEAFPTVIRLLASRRLLDELLAMPVEELAGIQELECCRLLGPNMDHDGLVGKADNAPLKLTAEQFWVHLNYQLIHSMDFLPATEWKARSGSGMFQLFIGLHQLLRRAGKLYAKVDFDSETWAEEAAEPQNGNAAMVDGFSKKIGHSLEYQLKVNGSSR